MVLTKREIKAMQVLNARKGGDNLLSPNFTAQNDFINDPARLKCALTNRRAGKSYSAGLYLYKEALKNPGCSVLYVALTRESAKKIMFKDVLKDINKKHHLGAKFNEVDLFVKLPNGSIIYLIGLNQDKAQMEKIRGQKLRLVVIDECASFTQDLWEIVYGVMKPCTIDYLGTVVMIGTPGNLISMGRKASEFAGDADSKAADKPLFYAATEGLVPGWSVHKWLASANPFMAEKMEIEINEQIASNPLVKDTPWFKKEYLAEWFVDVDKLVYKYSEDINSIDFLPEAENYTYILGLDFGYTDATAFVIVAYSPHDDVLYVVDAFKKKKMTVDDVEKKLKYFIGKYPISRFVVDNAAKQTVETLRARMKIPLEAAMKTEKAGHINIFNNDLMLGKIKLLPGRKGNFHVHDKGTDDLRAEWQGLIWDDSRSDRHEEHRGCENHLSDACLYAHRYSYNYLATKKPGKIDIHSAEAYEERLRLEEEQILGGKDKPFWQTDWESEFNPFGGNFGEY